MANEIDKNLKAVALRDKKALRLIYQKADQEGRSRSNALACTVKQALGQKQNGTLTDYQKQ